ncbi:MAG: hypothetical protein C3F14_03185 [Deltaproteobacteria bacterium]|nr:MAG: hypothetical protein C3F14_03185 [Deltaproteobacteria bacterium]
MLQIQVGKAIDLFASWGVRPKELSRFLESGVVKATRSGYGKGSLRLLDERSVYDVYLAHSFHELGLPPRRIARIVEDVRPQYGAWINGEQKWLVLRFRAPKSEAISPTTIRIDLSQPLALIRRCQSERDEIAPIRRGRPREDWRKRFRETAEAIAKELRKEDITEDEIDQAISEVRTGRNPRRGKDEIAVVTVAAR